MRQYKVAPDIGCVDGKPVPGNRIVTLSEDQALYDLAMGRISPVEAKAAEKRGKESAGNDGD